MPTQSDIAQQMIQGLAVTEPTLDTTIGSPVRSIVDVVAEVVAEAYAGQFLLNYQYDIYTKSGADLDAFVAQFGFTRFAAKRATGSITFSRANAATADIYISIGTQVATTDSPPIVFNTMTPVIMVAGTSSVSVPIQAQIGGTSGNVAANTLTTVTTLQMGFSTITNPTGCAGGTDPESDEALRARFVATVFRALTGTEPMFQAVGLDDPDVSQVNVIGASKVYSENIQIVEGFALSSVQDFAYLYPSTSALGPNLYAGDIFTEGVDYSIATVLMDPPIDLSVTNSSTGGHYSDIGTVGYAVVSRTSSGSTLPCSEVTASTSAGNLNSFALSWVDLYTVSTERATTSYDIYVDLGSGLQWLANTTDTSYTDTGFTTPGGNPPATATAYTPPFLSVIGSNIADGIYQLQYEYLPSSSRNDPVNGVTNRVDIYVNNQRPVVVTQDSQWTDGYPFTHNASDTYNVENFIRNDGTWPVPGNFFVPFVFSPVLDGAPTGPISVGGNNYVEGTDFWVVNNTTAFGYGPQSLSGVEWKSTANGASFQPSLGDAMSLDYTFNQIPTSVQKAAQNWRLVTTDVMVHQAKLLNLDMYLGIIMSSTTYSKATVLSQVETAISNYLASVSFDQVVQVSEILALVQNISGVVAVRFLNSGDSSSILYPTNVEVGSTFAIQSVNDADEVLQTYATNVEGQLQRAIDVPLSDDTLASLANVRISFFANNTFGAV